jgi:predicted nucleic acid-binding protein
MQRLALGKPMAKTTVPSAGASEMCELRPIHSSMSADDLLQAGELMTKYADVPMDYADATRVLLAGNRALRA